MVSAEARIQDGHTARWDVRRRVGEQLRQSAYGLFAMALDDIGL